MTVSADYRVAPGETLTFTNETGFQIQGEPSGAPDLTIEGAVTVLANNADRTSITGIQIGASSFYDCLVTIASTGVLRVTSTVAGGSASGYFSGSWSPDFINRGLVEVSARGQATGLTTWDAGPWLFENSGTFRVTSSEGDARGVYLANGGTFRNTGEYVVSGRAGAWPSR